MYIQWHGLSCFKIQGKKATVFIDPYFDTTGLRLKKTTADLVLFSHKDATNYHIITECAFFISSPGEYEVNDVFVWGIDAGDISEEENIIYSIDIDDFRIVHLGALADELKQSHLEQLDKVDILLIPVGGGVVLNFEKALKVVNQLQPSIIIPMYYKIDGLKLDLESVEKFCREFAVDPYQREDKFKISKKELQEADSKIVLLKRI